MSRKSAFTLVEVLLVVVIMGILAMAAIPRLTISYEKARLGEGIQLMTTLRSSQSRYCLDHGDCGTTNYPAPCSKLDLTVTPSNFNAPSCNANGTISMQRNNAAYTVSVDAAGAVTCVKSDGTNCEQALLDLLPASM